MTMRVIECNVCGEPLTAHDDEALARRLRAHVTAEHPEESMDEAAARSTVAAEAYTASDN
jgi:hypothetical protein